LTTIEGVDDAFGDKKNVLDEMTAFLNGTTT